MLLPTATAPQSHHQPGVSSDSVPVPAVMSGTGDVTLERGLSRPGRRAYGPFQNLSRATRWPLVGSGPFQAWISAGHGRASLSSPVFEQVYNALCRDLNELGGRTPGVTGREDSGTHRLIDQL